MNNLKQKIRDHRLLLSIIAFMLFLIIIIVVVIAGGADDCDTDSGGGGDWGWPFASIKDNNPQISGEQLFGYSASRQGNFHDGVDFGTTPYGGQDILAIHSGKVYKIGHEGTSQNDLGYYICVKSDDGYYEVYQEFAFTADQASKYIKVKEGDSVSTGSVIGHLPQAGESGSPAVTHIHIGVSKEEIQASEAKAFDKNGPWLDPVQLIKNGQNGGGKGTASSSGGGTSGSWTQKGSTEYNNAKGIFDTLTKKDGFSGAGGAGAVGNAIGESHLETAIVNAYGYGGLFQWSASRFSGTGGGHVKVGDKSTYTLENELETMQSELNGAYKKVKSSVGRATDVHQATWNWFIDYEGMAGNENQYGTQRDPGAKWAYQEFGGANIKANDKLLGAAADGADTGGASGSSDQDCNSDDDTSSGNGDIVGTAKSLLGYFHYGQVHGVSNIGSVDNPNKNGTTDCSGFVWLVLAKAGYKVPDNMGWYTKTMEQDARGSHQWLKQISSNDAGPGDILIVNTGSGAGDAGHTEILEEKYHGPDTKVIEEGGTGGSGGVNESTIGASMGSLLSGTQTFARAIKK